MKYRYERTKHKTGSSMVELTTLCCVALAVLLIAGDFGWIIIGFATNNGICARASRAASQGAPEQLQKGAPYKRAMAVLAGLSSTPGQTLDLPRSLSINQKLNTQKVDLEFGEVLSGEVSVTTTIHVHPPFILSRLFGPSGLALTASKIYPFTYANQDGQTI